MIAVLSSASAALLVLLCYLAYRIRKVSRAHSALNEKYSSLYGEHAVLREKYNRTQHGYQQGVAEGMGKAYANLRADWIDRLEKSTPQERAFLLTWRQSPMDAWERARVMMNDELRSITGPDNDVNYADLMKSDEPIKKMIKLEASA